ncbi:[Histone H4]-lysine(20) N-methyltransferase [Aphelenchoides bicaudatus]|nr:[Histone H4]-lysine(20) N-methyltransferase [Aphelenchoides bicaudatus]
MPQTRSAKRSHQTVVNGKVSKAKNNSPATTSAPNTKITDFFPIRKSQRRTEAQIQSEKDEHIKLLIETGYNEDFLRIYEHEIKGRGIKAGRPFLKDEFVVEYKGEIIEYAEARRREMEYAKNVDIGSYMYFFEHKSKKWCVDATAETKYKGRLVNHSYLKPNLRSRVVELPNSFHLCLFAKRNIQIGEELIYDYGDRRMRTVCYNPWLKCS